MATDAVETIVTVVDVDQEARIVTVRGPQGGLTDLVVGEDVKAYDEVEIGDTVTVQYTEGLAMRMIHQ